jgi:hypothetical protein
MKLRKEKTTEPNATYMPHSKEPDKEEVITYAHETAPVEMPAHRAPIEMMGERYVAELPDSHAVKTLGGATY